MTEKPKAYKIGQAFYSFIVKTKKFLTNLFSKKVKKSFTKVISIIIILPIILITLPFFLLAAFLLDKKKIIGKSSPLKWIPAKCIVL